MNPTPLSSIRTRLAAIAAALAPAVRVVRDKLRGLTLLLVGIATLWLIAVPNPLVENTNTIKVGLIAWLVCKESVLAYLGYWIDRLLHPRSRPGQFGDAATSELTTVENTPPESEAAILVRLRFEAFNVARMAAEKRRAFIICAAMLAGGLFQ
ncbi:MAG: hypothetical protein J0I77_09405 [Rudaea sp.]|uniref:putative holin n=1 Tax=unclassified Rudaea TaxID=2627037 RepID=UPI0010F7A8A4|nr:MULTISPECIES: putative holin [unclassified Rudaea]MBN8885923.1 hypothetical protein [Rudaea sp.]MBR0346996.1 hypothetical protein [Rudaea sp.]